MYKIICIAFAALVDFFLPLLLSYNWNTALYKFKDVQQDDLTYIMKWLPQ